MLTLCQQMSKRHMFVKEFMSNLLTFGESDDRLNQQRVVRTKLDIYVFITITESISLLVDY